MKQQDIKFCQEHIINFESVKLGFTRNIPFNILGEYERMYREYLDAQFSLTYWCGECVFDMLKRLITYYEQSQVITEQSEVQSQEITAQQEVQTEEVALPKKKGRRKKNG